MRTKLLPFGVGRIRPSLLWSLVIGLLTLSIGVALVAAKERAAPHKGSSFAGVSGTSFTLDGKPFYVTGANNLYLTWGTDLEVTRVLDDAVSLGVNTVRIFLSPVIGSLDDSKPTIWDWKQDGHSATLAVHDTYMLYWDSSRNQMGINDGPNGLQRVDQVIAEAGRRKLKLIIDFLDYWAYTGGAQQITAWYIDEDHRPTSALQPKPVMDYHFFYADPRTRHDYQEWIRHVIEHVNGKTGVRYRDDPTIMAWELMNEPIIDSDVLRYQWTSEMSGFVKSLDQKHLVGAGSINSTPPDLAKDLVVSTIDYGTWHGYPIHDKMTPEQFTARIPKYCDIATVYKKPVLMEEFGYARSNPDQISTYQTWLDTVDTNRDCAGWLVWVLVSRQQDGQLPPDEYDQFNVVNDGGPLWTLLKSEIAKGRTRDTRLARTGVNG